MSKHVKLDWDDIHSASPPAFEFRSRRSVVYSTTGMVCATQPLAVKAGLEILRAGGNAADAAVATAAALNVTEPTSTGVGGDLFCLYYDAKTKRVRGLNGSGRSPKALTLDVARAHGHRGRELPKSSLDSVTVPGAAAGWCDILETFGSGKVSRADVLKPAIHMAKEGVPISELAACMWQESEQLLRKNKAEAMLIDGQRAPRAGEIIQMPDLASTFESIAEHGKDGFYRGRIAKAIVDLVHSRGGVLTLEDLAGHTSTLVEPLTMDYGDPDHTGNITLHECPPNGQGLVALLALGIVEAVQKSGKVRPLEQLGHNSAEYLHVLIEALRLAFADGRYYISDLEKGQPPLESLLSTAYLEQRAKTFDPDRANLTIRHGSPVNASDTTYFSTSDSDGNACSFIISNYDGFGTGAIPRGCGFTLQNRGSNFVLEKGHPNCLEGDKRPYHTIIPAMVTRKDDLWLSYGVMGGFMQPQGHLQVLLNILHFKMGLQEALDAPRICLGSGMPVSRADTPGTWSGQVFIEHGIPDRVLEQLRKMGHDAERVTGFARSQFGRGQIIRKRRDERSGRIVWEGASDPRGDGYAGPS